MYGSNHIYIRQCWSEDQIQHASLGSHRLQWLELSFPIWQPHFGNSGVAQFIIHKNGFKSP